jgi:hypothetical protein
MPHMMLNGDKADFETKKLFDEMCRLVSRHEFPTWRVFVQRNGPSFEVTVTEQESGAHEPVFDSTRAGGDTAEAILTAFDRVVQPRYRPQRDEDGREAVTVSIRLEDASMLAMLVPLPVPARLKFIHEGRERHAQCEDTRTPVPFYREM